MHLRRVLVLLLLAPSSLQGSRRVLGERGVVKMRSLKMRVGRLLFVRLGSSPSGFDGSFPRRVGPSFLNRIRKQYAR